MRIRDTAGRALIAIAAAVLAACTQAPHEADTPSTEASALATWKVAIFAGDPSREFDNARRQLSEMFLNAGVQPENIRQLTSSLALAKSGPAVRSATPENLQAALAELKPTSADTCLVYLTSHGSRQGVAYGNGDALAPAQLISIVDGTCGASPSILVVSACYSGVFVNDRSVTNQRIIFTAAAADRPSFGCGGGTELNFYDRCFLESFPEATDWRTLAGLINNCVVGLERTQKTAPSLPQFFIGRELDGLAIRPTKN